MNTELKLYDLDNDGEPRVLDTDLAERLGMANSLHIRTNVIARHRDELETYGTLFFEVKKTFGRPSKVYYLNEQQALLVVMYSRTEKAAELRREIIQVFHAWRHGRLVPANASTKPALPDFSDPIAMARVWADAEEAKKEALTVIKELAVENDTLATENCFMSDELNIVTLDEWRALKHLYLSQSEKGKLSRKAKVISEKLGLPVTKQERTITVKGVQMKTMVNVYYREALEKA